MRYLIHVTRAGRVFYIHGHGSSGELVASDEVRAWRNLYTNALNAGPGFYHAKVSIDLGRVYSHLGKSFSLSKYIGQLAARLHKAPTQARTNSPGIKGYQEREFASQCAADAARHRNEKWLAWLTQHAAREEA